MTDEIYKRIYNFDGTPTKYIISNYGDIIDTDKCIRLHQYIIGYTYHKGKKYKLKKPRKTVHIKKDGETYCMPIYRLEMMVFHPLNDYHGMEVDHIDGNPDNNYIGNLEWVSHAENMRRAKSLRLLRHDDGHPNSVYKNELIRNICKEIAKGTSRKAIRKMFNVNGQLIDDIRSGRSHRYISELYINDGFKYKEKPSDCEIQTRNKLVKRICSMIEGGFTNKQIYEMLAAYK